MSCFSGVREKSVVPRCKPRTFARGEAETDMSQTIAYYRSRKTGAIKRYVDEPPKPFVEPRRIDAPASDLAEGGERDVAIVTERGSDGLLDIVERRFATEPATERSLQRADLAFLCRAQQRGLSVAQQ